MSTDTSQGRSETNDLPIQIGVIGDQGGCSSGLGANLCSAVMSAARNVSLLAVADILDEELSFRRYSPGMTPSQPVPVPKGCYFHGWDAYKKLLAMPEVNYVILTPAPHFRPQYLRAAIEAGKHVYVESPVAIDGPGVRSVLESAELARQKGLGIQVRYALRYHESYRETIRRLQEGAIGEIVYCQTFWNQWAVSSVLSPRQPAWSDTEWQLRNWRWFTWLAGDLMLDLTTRNLDIVNWLLKSHPIKAMGMGGRQADDERGIGDRYDHFAVEYAYPNDVHVQSQCRAMNECAARVGEIAAGTLGKSNCISSIQGKNPWRFSSRSRNPYEVQLTEFIRSIREGNPINNAASAAETALTAIMGREAAYSGQEIGWEQALNSTRRLGPDRYKFGPMPTPPIPVPGRYRFA